MGFITSNCYQEPEPPRIYRAISMWLGAYESSGHFLSVDTKIKVFQNQRASESSCRFLAGNNKMSTSWPPFYYSVLEIYTKIPKPSVFKKP